MGNKSSSKHSSAAPKPQARHDTAAPRKQRTINLETETRFSSELSDAVKARRKKNSKGTSAETWRGPAQVVPRNLPTTKLKTYSQHRTNLSSQQGSNTTTTKQQERCYDPRDPTLVFVNGEDDMDFELIGYESLRAKMSCGHTVTPTSLMNWCKRLLNQGETRFVCGVCDAEWPCGEVYKMALMTPEEIDHFDRTLFKRAVPDLLGAKKCPGCKCLAVREDLNDLRVRCTVCTANKGRCYEFCWQCLKEWRRPSPYPDRCAEHGCVSQQLEILKTCPEIKFKDMRNVTGCPSIRACPTCGLLIEHSSERCKNITCRRCNVQFCFVCLRLTEECKSLKPVSDFSPCYGGVASRQKVIPVWKQK